MDNVSLTIRDAEGAERLVNLLPGTTQIGRSEDVDITLPSQSVSRLHAQIIVGADDVVIEDLGSGNGIIYRGQRVDSMSLNDGHELYIDPYTLIFQIPNQPSWRCSSTQCDLDAERSGKMTSWSSARPMVRRLVGPRTM